jgi:hypothetical protein
MNKRWDGPGITKPPQSLRSITAAAGVKALKSLGRKGDGIERGGVCDRARRRPGSRLNAGHANLWRDHNRRWWRRGLPERKGHDRRPEEPERPRRRRPGRDEHVAFEDHRPAAVTTRPEAGDTGNPLHQEVSLQRPAWALNLKLTLVSARTTLDLETAIDGSTSRSRDGRFALTGCRLRT